MALTKCGECGREVSNQALACPGCGAPIKPAVVVPPKEKTGCGTMVIGGIAGLIVLSAIINAIDETTTTTDKPKGDPNEGVAAYACQTFVKERLKAPKTADFPWRYDVSRDSTDQNKYTIVSYVDAQNSFGALIRTHYSCVVRAGGTSMRLIDLKTWTN